MLAVGGLQGVAMPSLNALMSSELGPERQGELQGGMASVMGLSSVVGPLLLTQTMAHFSARDAPVVLSRRGFPAVGRLRRAVPGLAARPAARRALNSNG